jgi:hypothetical protein
MPSVLIPKYSLGQISTNFFKRSAGTNISQFIGNNFVNANGSIAAANPKQLVNQIPNDLLNSILTDYGNGTISKGLDSLALINRNVVNGTQLSGDIFNNNIIYGADVNFKTVTLAEGRMIVVGNLNMLQIINIAPSSLQTTFYNIVDNIVNDLKNGKYLSTNYSAALIRNCKQIAQAVSRTINASNI